MPPPRIVYWTSAFDAHMEAVASEVAMLRRHFPSSFAWGLTPRAWASLDRRGLRFHPRGHLLFRFLVRLLEPAFDLNHVFGSLADWFYLQGPRRRPTVLTSAAWAEPLDGVLYERVDRFVVECPAGEDQLLALGVPAAKVRLILPPVDLRRFAPAPPPPGPFTVLFASSPDSAAGLGDRGVPQLLDAAALRPQHRFRLLWRPWGDRGAWVRQRARERGLHNVEVVTGCADMERQYRRAHVTVAPFTARATTKPAPNSLIESLACGRPVVLTDVVGLAEVIAQGGAGRVCAPSGEGIAQELDRLQREWGAYAARARRLAERRFATGRFLEEYGRLYDEVLRRPVPASPRPTVNFV